MAADVPWIAGLIEESAAASDWLPDVHNVLVVAPVGFVAYRTTFPGEGEILNLAVRKDCRRQGVARLLLRALLALEAVWFLEVRPSNTAARALYEQLGFRAVGLRRQYYGDPIEDGIVLKYEPC